MGSDKVTPEKWEKLTKKFYMQLPTGLYLISSAGWAPTKPIFCERAADIAGREQQWKRVVECEVSQRMCIVFNSRGEHRRWVKQVMKDSGRQP